MDLIRKVPPVTRFLVGSSLAVTVGVILKAVDPYLVLFERDLVFSRKLQLWRLYTSFFLGSGGLTYIFEVVMLYQTAHEIETKSYHLRSSDLAWQTFWVALGIIGASWPLRPFIFARPFLISFLYLYSALAPPGVMTSIMGLVTVPLKYYPYITIAFDLIIAGPSAAALSVAGAVVGHIWWWSVWGGNAGSQGILSRHARAPEWLRKFMGETGPRIQPPEAGGTAAGLARAGIHVMAPRRPATAGGAPTGHSWGSGRQLGR